MVVWLEVWLPVGGGGVQGDAAGAAGDCVPPGAVLDVELVLGAARAARGRA
jgi:hypothetical protein